MAIVVKVRSVELDTSPVDARIRSFPPRTRQHAERACEAVYERTCAKAAFIDPGTTWRFMEFENYFTLEVEVFHDAVVIHDIEITKPRDFDLGCFVIWYDGYQHLMRVPIGDGPANFLADVRLREAACDANLVSLLKRHRDITAKGNQLIDDCLIPYLFLEDGLFRTFRKSEFIVRSNLFIYDRVMKSDDIVDPEIGAIYYSDALNTKNGRNIKFSDRIEIDFECLLVSRMQCKTDNKYTTRLLDVELEAWDDAEFGIIMAGLLYGSMANHVSDADSLRRYIGAAMRSLVRTTPAVAGTHVMPAPAVRPLNA